MRFARPHQPADLPSLSRTSPPTPCPGSPARPDSRGGLLHARSERPVTARDWTGEAPGHRGRSAQGSRVATAQLPGADARLSPPPAARRPDRWGRTDAAAMDGGSSGTRSPAAAARPAPASTTGTPRPSAMMSPTTSDWNCGSSRSALGGEATLEPEQCRLDDPVDPCGGVPPCPAIPHLHQPRPDALRRGVQGRPTGPLRHGVGDDIVARQGPECLGVGHPGALRQSADRAAERPANNQPANAHASPSASTATVTGLNRGACAVIVRDSTSPRPPGSARSGSRSSRRSTPAVRSPVPGWSPRCGRRRPRRG